MDNDELRKWKRAGNLASKAREYGKEEIEEGVGKLELVEAVENFIRKNGGTPAFPANLAVNNIAAHWTPNSNDKGIFEYGDVVKLDVGVEIDGYIGDTALTVEVGTEQQEELLNSSRQALKNAIDIMRAGISTQEIGGMIQKTVENFGFKPISNLTGHAIERYNLHTGIAIPNVKEGRGRILEKGIIVAVEPFSTNGAGSVKGKHNSNIYQLKGKNSVKDDKANKLLNQIKDRFKGLPFAERWLHEFDTNPKSNLQKLIRQGVVKFYPVLEEMGGGMVSQFEHTIYLKNDGVEVLTK